MSPISAALLASLALAQPPDVDDPVHAAVFHGTATELKELLKQSPSLANKRAPTGATPLYHAAWMGRLDIMEVLIEYEADLNASSPKGTPLHVAVWRGHTDAAKLLLKKGARLDIHSAVGLGK